MEILKRARGHSDGEILPFNHSEKDIKEEVNKRTCKAGYTDRDGQPKVSRSNGAGKGDNTASRTNWGKWHSGENPLPDSALNLWPRDEAGNLID